MKETFDTEGFIDHYINNIRAMQHLTDAQIREVMLQKIEKNPEYFEIISDVTQKVENKKLIRQVIGDTQEAQNLTPNIDEKLFTGRKIA